MDNITIGLYVSTGMLVMVLLGMRVAFAAGLAGFVGLVWLRWNGFDYDPNAILEGFANQRESGRTNAPFQSKRAGSKPHSGVYIDWLSCLLCKISQWRCLRPQNDDCLGARWLGGINGVCHCGLCGGFGRIGCNGCGLCVRSPFRKC